MPTGINGLKYSVPRMLTFREQWAPSQRRGKDFRVHTEKTFPNLIKSTRNQIVFSIFRLIWIQFNRKMENKIWFLFDLSDFEKISLCACGTIMARCIHFHWNYLPFFEKIPNVGLWYWDNETSQYRYESKLAQGWDDMFSLTMAL